MKMPRLCKHVISAYVTYVIPIPSLQTIRRLSRGHRVPRETSDIIVVPYLSNSLNKHDHYLVTSPHSPDEPHPLELATSCSRSFVFVELSPDPLPTLRTQNRSPIFIYIPPKKIADRRFVFLLCVTFCLFSGVDSRSKGK